MKKVYLFLTVICFAFVSVGYGSLANDGEATKWSPTHLGKCEIGGFDDGQVLKADLSNRAVESVSNRPTMRLSNGKTAYGYCLFDKSWGSTQKNYGIYSFNTSNPANKTKMWGSTLAVDAGAYYDGYYYVQTSTNNGFGYTSMKFGRLDAATGDYKEIADWFDPSIYPCFVDMTIDYSTTPPSLLGVARISATTRKLSRIDMETGEITAIASGFTPSVIVLACKYDGTLYGVTNEGKLVRIDKSTGEAHNVGTGWTGVLPKYLQSAEFDHSDGTLYWAMCESEISMKLGTINLETGVFTAVSNDEIGEFSALYIPKALAGAPERIANLTLIPAVEGKRSADLSWTNPSKDNKGGDLLSINTVKIYRDGELIKTFDNPAVGSAGVFVDNVSADGRYRYKIVVSNSVGEGEPVFAESFVGEDLPGKPTNVVLKKNGSKAVISWLAPAKSLNGGWFDVDEMKYVITRLPDNVVVADNVEGLTYTDGSIDHYDVYSYTVQAKTAAGLGGMETSNQLAISSVMQLPYSCKFESESEFGMWTVVDNNNDGKTWTLDTEKHAAKYWYHSKNDADDWMMSPSIALKAGKSYRLSFTARANTKINAESLKVFLGQGVLPENQTKELIDIPSITVLEFEPHSVMFDVPESDEEGDYNLGFKAYSVKNKHYLFFTDVLVEEVFENDLSASAISGQAMPMMDKEGIYVVDVVNKGTVEQSAYTVQLISGDEVLNTVDIEETLAPGETKKVSLTWTPSEMGMVELKGRIISESDQYLDNNETAPLSVDVQLPSDQEWAIVGTGNEMENVMPINFFYKMSTTQSIYLADEIGFAGKIKRVVYSYNNESVSKVDFVNRPIRIYMASTERTDLLGGWIPASEMTLVFDGKVNVMQGVGELSINLTTPFVHAGGNLCVMVVRDADNQNAANYVKFILTKTGSDVRTLTYSSDRVAFDYTQEGVARTKIPNIKILAVTAGAGKIEGVIEGNDGVKLSGVKVKLNPLGTTTMTDNNGFYTFGFVPAGSYGLEISKHGYQSLTVNDVIAEEEETTIKNMIINELSKYLVTGTVKDLAGKAIEGALVNVGGYNSYSAITGADGGFSIAGVYKADDYSIEVVKAGFVNHTGTFNVVDGNVVLETIAMVDVTNKPTDVVAAVDGGNVILNWEAPVVDYKAMVGYKVWRLKAVSQDDESKWVLLTENAQTELTFTDNRWSEVGSGAYKYAVKTVYTGGIESEAALSNVVDKDMNTDIIVNVKITGTSIAVNGAEVKLANNDGVDEHIYRAKTDATGNVLIENVYKGIYSVEIRAVEYADLKVSDVDFSTNDSYDVDYTLDEAVVEPYNLQMVKTDIDTEWIFNWNIFNSIYDDFERVHTDFAINSQGGFGWSYIDGDAKQTCIIKDVSFANMSLPMAYMVFNPKKTTPVLSSAVWNAHSGDRYLISFASIGGVANNDWIISPEIKSGKAVSFEFWAKSATVQYGKERFRVAYSTSGKSQGDFTNVLTSGEYAEVGAEWTKFTYTLPAEAKYVAINCVSNDAFAFMIDDIAIGNQGSRGLLNYEVYLDGVKVSTVDKTTHTFSDLSFGTHKAGVKAVYQTVSSQLKEIGFNVVGCVVNYKQSEHGMLTVMNGAETVANGEMVEKGAVLTITATPNENYMLGSLYVNDVAIEGLNYTVNSNVTIRAEFVTVGVDDMAEMSLRIYPNPLSDVMYVEGEYTSLEMYDAVGKLIMTANGESQIDVSAIKNGAYIVRVYNGNKTMTYRVIK